MPGKIAKMLERPAAEQAPAPVITSIPGFTGKRKSNDAGGAMDEITELQMYRDEIGLACHQARDFLMQARKSAPSADTWNETSDFIQAFWELVTEHIGVLKNKTSNMEDDLSHEDMRRERGNYFKSIRRRVA